MRRILTTLCIVLPLAAPAAPAPDCEEAWAAYNEFRLRNRMDPAQYPLTVQGAAVRAACGAQALPVPPGSDTPPLPIIRKPPRPLPPPPPETPRPRP